MVFLLLRICTFVVVIVLKSIMITFVWTTLIKKRSVIENNNLMKTTSILAFIGACFQVFCACYYLLFNSYVLTNSINIELLDKLKYVSVFFNLLCLVSWVFIAIFLFSYCKNLNNSTNNHLVR